MPQLGYIDNNTLVMCNIIYDGIVTETKKLNDVRRL